MGARHPDDAMSRILHDRLEVHGDQRLVLDDEHVRRHLRRNLAAGLGDQLAQPFDGNVEHEGRVALVEPLHCGQQKSLPAQRRQRIDPVFGDRPGLLVAFGVHSQRIPDLGEHPIQRHARAEFAVETGRILDQRLQNGDHIGVAGLLRPRQGPRVATKVRQMGNNLLRNRHGPTPIV